MDDNTVKIKEYEFVVKHYMHGEFTYKETITVPVPDTGNAWDRDDAVDMLCLPLDDKLLETEGYEYDYQLVDVH